MSISRIAAFALLALSLAGCVPVSPSESAAAATTAYAPEFPRLTCSRFGLPNGRENRLTASRVTPGDPAYIEFRQRASPAIPSGHLFVVFGRLDPSGKPVTRQYIGLYPVGSVFGLYGGAVVPVPAHLEPNIADCRFPAAAAFRVSLSEDRYQRVLSKVRSILAKPPLWHLIAYNCNHFAADIGAAAGLRPAPNRNAWSFVYIHSYIKANQGAPATPAS